MQALSFHQRCCKSTFSAKKPFQVFLRLFERLLRLFNFELLYCSPGSVDVLGGCCAMCKHCHSIRDAVKVHFQLKNPSKFFGAFLRDYYAFSILSFYTVLLGLLMFWGLLCNVQALSFHQRCCKSTFSAKKPFQVFWRLFERLLHLFNFELLYCSPASVDVLGGCCAMCKHCHSIRDAVKVHFQLKNPSKFFGAFLRDYYAFSILSFYTVLLGLLMFWGVAVQCASIVIPSEML